MFIPYPLQEQLEGWTAAVAALRHRLPQALLLTTRPPPDEWAVHPAAVEPHLEMVLRSFEEASAFVAPRGTATA